MSLPNAPQTRVRALEVSGWRQFDDIKLEFHDRLTIITGANGAGKTTVLNLLALPFGWHVPLATTPSLVSRAVEYLTGVWPFSGKPQQADLPEKKLVGQIQYETASTLVMVPQYASEHTYTVQYADEIALRGLYIPSHRPVFVPTQVKSERDPVGLLEAFNRYSAAVRNAWMPESRRSRLSPLQILKQTLLSWFGAQQVDWDAFSAKLLLVLPHSLGFKGLTATGDEIILNTETGDFTLDAVSGGIAAMIDLAWQIFTYAGASEERFVVLIDEPENHLHPEMQRTVLHKLIEAFPAAQFIVSSHEPLIVTSVADAAVYALVYKDFESGEGGHGSVGHRPGRAVIAQQLSGFDRAGTANDVLRDVLGLDYTMPIWAAKILDEATTAVAREGYTPEALRKLDERLKESSLEAYGVEAAAELGRRARSEREQEPA